MRVAHFMTLNPVTCEADDPCTFAAALMRDRGVGCVVVLRDGRVCGLVTDRMLVTECLAGGLDPDAPVSDIMLEDPVCVRPDDNIFAVCDTLRGANLARRAPVLNQRDELVGVVSISDIAVIARDLVDAVLHEETHNSLREARALTGGKRIIKRIRRPAKADRIPEAPVVPKRRASRPGLVKDVLPSRRKLGNGKGPASRPRSGASRPSGGRGRGYVEIEPSDAARRASVGRIR